MNRDTRTMNMDTDFTLNDSYVTVGGGSLIPHAVDEFARKWVGGHYLISFALILFLTLVVMYHLVRKYRGEGFNPTQTLRYQDGDQFGSGGREKFDNPSVTTTTTVAPGADRSQSVFAQTVQDAAGGSFTVDPHAAINAPGSLGFQILTSPDFGCATRTPVGNDAWAWMTHAAESMQGNMKTDNVLSQIAAGQR